MSESAAQQVTWTQIHWRSNDLLEVPPVLLVTEFALLRFRQFMACHMDGRHVNDALYRAVLAIRCEFELEPHAYVVAFPAQAFELPIDIRSISGESTQLAGFVKAPRSIRESPFDVTGLDEALANHVRVNQRNQSIRLLKSLTEDGSEIVLSDLCESGERFCHRFHDGAYNHNYRYVASMIPELEKHVSADQ